MKQRNKETTTKKPRSLCGAKVQLQKKTETDREVGETCGADGLGSVRREGLLPGAQTRRKERNAATNTDGGQIGGVPCVRVRVCECHLPIAPLFSMKSEARPRP